MTDDPKQSERIHNLRNQLNNIAMNAELAKLELATQGEKSIPTATDAQVLECIEAILTACRASTTIIDTLSARGAPAPEPSTPDRQDGK